MLKSNMGVGRFMVAAGAVLEDLSTHNILVVKRSSTQDFHPNEWEITYGRINQFETIEEGLLREYTEETGITSLTVHQPLRAFHFFRGDRLPENEVIGLTFYATVPTQPIVKISDEHQEFRWVTPEEAMQLIEAEGIKKDIQIFIDFKKKERHA